MKELTKSLKKHFQHLLVLKDAQALQVILSSVFPSFHLHKR